MLRPVYRNPAGPTRAMDPVTEVAALTGLAEPRLTFIARGVTGGYLNAFESLTASTIRAEHVDREERDVRAFSVKLRPHEQRRVMERLWEAERRGYFPYRFFSDNCASYTAFILGGAVDEARAVEITGPIVLPTAVLDACAVERKPSVFVSHRAAAAAAERRQNVLVSQLAEDVPAHAREWRAVIRETRSLSPRVRARAYARLPSLAQRTISDVVHSAPSVVAIVEEAVIVERYAAQESFEQVRRTDLARMVFPADARLPTAEQLVTERQRRYQREDQADRLYESVANTARWIRFFKQVPRRPATREEIASVDEAGIAIDTFLTLTRIFADLADRYDAAAASASAVTDDANAWPKQRSGLGRLAVGLGVDGAATGAGTFLVLRTAFGSEALGDRRAHGLDPLAEVRFLETELRLGAGEPLPVLHSIQSTLLRVRSMPREPSLTRRHLIGDLGYGAAVVSRWDASRRQRHSAWAEAVVPLWHAPEYEHHLVFGAGPMAAASGIELPDQASVGGRFELSARTQLSTRTPSSARASVTWTPLLGVYGAPSNWAHETRAAASLEVAHAAQARAQLELSIEANWRWTGNQPQRTVGVAMLLGTP